MAEIVFKKRLLCVNWIFVFECIFFAFCNVFKIIAIQILHIFKFNTKMAGALLRFLKGILSSLKYIINLKYFLKILLRLLWILFFDCFGSSLFYCNFLLMIIWVMHLTISFRWFAQYIIFDDYINTMPMIFDLRNLCDFEVFLGSFRLSGAFRPDCRFT